MTKDINQVLVSDLKQLNPEKISNDQMDTIFKSITLKYFPEYLGRTTKKDSKELLKKISYGLEAAKDDIKKIKDNDDWKQDINSDRWLELNTMNLFTSRIDMQDWLKQQNPNAVEENLIGGSGAVNATTFDKYMVHQKEEQANLKIKLPFKIYDHYQYLETATYEDNDAPAVILTTGDRSSPDYDSEPITTNTRYGSAFDINNSSEAIEQLQKAGIIKLDGGSIQSGFVSYPTGELNYEKINKLARASGMSKKESIKQESTKTKITEKKQINRTKKER